MVDNTNSNNNNNDDYYNENNNYQYHYHYYNKYIRNYKNNALPGAQINDNKNTPGPTTLSFPSIISSNNNACKKSTKGKKRKITISLTNKTNYTV